MSVYQRKMMRSPAAWVPRRGDTVLIHKGAVLRSTHPQWGPEETRLAGRSYPVKVVRAYYSPVRTSYDDPDGYEGFKDVVFVEWAGAGGYWKWCEARHASPMPTDLERLAGVKLPKRRS